MYKTNRAAIILYCNKYTKNEYTLFFIKIQFLTNFGDFQTMRTQNPSCHRTPVMWDLSFFIGRHTAEYSISVFSSYLRKHMEPGHLKHYQFDNRYRLSPDLLKFC